MIVAATEGPQRRILVGLTEEDVKYLTEVKGRTKVKDGNPQYGFHTLIVFIGDSDESMIKMLSSAATVRSDNMLPNIGSG